MQKMRSTHVDAQLLEIPSSVRSDLLHLVALNEPLHGYALMQKVEVMSEGTLVIGHLRSEAEALLRGLQLKLTLKIEGCKMFLVSLFYFVAGAAVLVYGFKKE